MDVITQIDSIHQAIRDLGKQVEQLHARVNELETSAHGFVDCGGYD